MYPFKLLAALVLPAAVIAALLWLDGESPIASCLDNGGRWDVRSAECDGARMQLAGYL